MTGTDTTPLQPAGASFDIAASYARSKDAAGALQSAKDVDGAIAAVLAWNDSQRQQIDWSSSQSIRFRQDTTDASAKKAKQELDAAAAKLEETRSVFLKVVTADELDPAIRAGLVKRFGQTVLDRWAAEHRTFSADVADDLAKEQSIQSEAMALTGSASVEFQGETKTLSALGAFLNHENRDIRRDAATARWSWFAKHRDALDQQFDDLVSVRTRIAKKLGRDSFTELAYDRMRRTDYTAEDVAAFRAGIRETVVPHAAAIRAGQAKALGLPRLSVFDEPASGSGKPPTPSGTTAEQIARAHEMFARTDETHGQRLGTLFGLLDQNGLLDLEERPGKGPGGFCSFLPTSGLPFVFANFNGSLNDVRVFTHEMGHAYQGWCSHASLELIDQRRCTSESAEIHSMSLEFLTWPWMELFFDGDADRFRTDHLSQSITFLPYGCAIDHFQHEIYARPDMSAAERHDVWKEMERLYLPWRNWDGIPHGSEGAAWQAQLHVYQYPFYYIDYVLAQFVALQFLQLAQTDAPGAWDKFQVLCNLGGSFGFRELVAKSGLGDPFDPKVIAGVMSNLPA